MKKFELEKQIDQLFRAIESCLQMNLIEPSLILIYSGIDIMASLDRNINHDSVKRSDFINWVDTYLFSFNNFPCTALELYAARCGVVHSYSPASNLSNRGNVRQIAYAHGVGKLDKLQKAIDAGSYSSKVVAIHLNELVEAFKAGVNKFLSSLSADSAREQLILARAEKFFHQIGLRRLDNYLKATEIIKIQS